MLCMDSCAQGKKHPSRGERTFQTFRIDSSPLSPDTWRFRRTSFFQAEPYMGLLIPQKEDSPFCQTRAICRTMTGQWFTGMSSRLVPPPRAPFPLRRGNGLLEPFRTFRTDASPPLPDTSQFRIRTRQRLCEDRVLDGPASRKKYPRVEISSTVFEIGGGWVTPRNKASCSPLQGFLAHKKTPTPIGPT